jgi:hypothetical protein
MVERAVSPSLGLWPADKSRDPLAIPAKPVAEATRKRRRDVIGNS